MTRISRTISDIGVICCFFLNIGFNGFDGFFFIQQRMTRMTRNYFVLLPDEPDESDYLLFHRITRTSRILVSLTAWSIPHPLNPSNPM